MYFLYDISFCVIFVFHLGKSKCICISIFENEVSFDVLFVIVFEKRIQMYLLNNAFLK